MVRVMRGKRKLFVYLSIGMLFLLVLTIGIILNNKLNYGNTDRKLSSLGSNQETSLSQGTTETDGVLLKETPQNQDEPAKYTSLGQEISKEEVNNAYKSLPAQTQATVTKEQVAESIATKNVLVVEAKNKQITVSDDEVDAFIQNSLAQASMTIDDYNNRLAQAGIGEEQYKAELKEQIMIAKLINDSINPENYSVSDSEVNSFIDANKDAYADFIEDENPAILETLKARIKFEMEQKKKVDLLKAFIEDVKINNIKTQGVQA